MSFAEQGGPGRWAVGRWLVLLAVLAVVPLALLAAYASWQSQQLQHLRALEQVAGLSGLAAESAEGYALQTRMMLAEVAAEEALQRQDPAATRQALADHLAAYAASYADITAARADGTVYADPLTALDAPAPSIASEPYSQEAMQSGQVAIQSVVQGEEVRLDFCRPILDAAGRPIGTVEAISDPIETPSLASPAPLPAGASLALAGPQRTIVLHSDDPAHEAGRALLASEESLAADGPDGAHEGQFLGQTVVISASAVAGTPWRVLVAVPAERALAGWQATLRGLVAAFAVTLGVPLFLGVRSASVGERGWQRQDFLRSLVDSASVGVAVVEGPENRLEFANPVYQRFLGGAPESAAGRPLREVLPAQMAEVAEGYIAEAYRIGGPVQAREVAAEMGEPARTSYWDVDYLPLQREEGRPPAMLILAMPVSERVRARREVEALAAQAQQRAAQLQAVLSAITDAVLVVDAEQNPIFVNDAVARWLGGEPTPELLRRAADLVRQVELFWPDGAPIQAAERQLPRALQGEVIVDEEVMYRPPQGGPLRWARVSAAPVRDEGRITGAVVTTTDITVQKQTQAERERLLAEVQAAHENLRIILDRLPDWVVVLDTSLRVTLANAAARRDARRGAVGMTAAQLRDMHELTDAEGHPFPPAQTPAERALRGEVVTGVEGRVHLGDGSVLNVLESAAPLYDSEGRLYGVVAAVTDITARKQAEAERERLLAEVQAARENLRIILDRLPDGVMVVDTAQRVIMSNETNRRYVGQDMAGMTLPELRDVYGFVMPDGRPFPSGQAPIERALRGEVVTGVAARILRLDGRTVDALESAAPLYDREGRLSGAVVALSDITALRQAQAEVRRAQQYLQMIVNRLPDGVAVIDSTLRVTLVNEASRQVLGRDITGMSLAELDQGFRMLSPVGVPLPAEERPVQRLQRGEPVSGTELRLQRPDGSTVDLLLGATALYDHELTAAILTMTDITARKEAERERERLLVEIQRARADLYTTIDRLPDWVLVLDTSLRVTLANAAIRRDAGRDLVGMTAAELWSAYEFGDAQGRPFPPGQSPAERAMRGEAVANVEGRVRLPDGTAAIELESAAPLYDSEGRLYGAVVILTDITARKRAEAERERLLAEVQRVRENLFSIIDRLPDWVMVFDLNLTVTLSNEAMRRRAGRDVAGMTVADLRRAYQVVSADGQPFPPGQSPVERALRGEAVANVEVSLRQSDGTEACALESAAPLYEPEGRLYGVVLVLTDITARKRAEAERERLLAEVQSTREQLQTTLNQLPDVVLAFDQDLQVTLANNAARDYLGRDPTGGSLADLLDGVMMELPDGRPFPRAETPMRRALAGETVTGVEMGVRQEGGPRVTVLVGGAPLYGPEGRATAPPIGAVVTVTDITDRKRVEAERERLLAEVEAARRNLELVVDRLPDGVLVADAALRITLANEGARSWLGSDIVGRPVGEVVRRIRFETADGRPMAESQWPMQRAMRGEQVSGMEVRAVIPDRGTFDLLASAVALRDGEGRVIGAVLAVTDITARRRAQVERERLLAEVEEARGNLQTMLRWLPAGVVAVGLDLRVAFTNEVIQQFLGRDLAGAQIFGVVREYGVTLPDGQPFAMGEQNPLLRALRGEAIANLEALTHLPDGRRVNVLASIAPMRGPDGTITGAVIATLDVTAERQAQAERERLLDQVEEGRRELQTIIDQLPDTVIVADANGRVSLSNRSAREYAGREIVGLTLPELHRLYDYRRPDGQRFPEEDTPFERALRGEVVVGAEGSVALPDGRRYDVLKSAAPVLAPDGTVREAAAVLVDVTGLKELDRAKDQFISVAAHELRTPLTALKGHAQILLRHAERAGWAERDRRNLYTIDEQVDRLDELIDRLLNVSRIRLGRLQLSRKPTDIVALTRRVAEELQVTTDRHRITVQAELPEIVGNWDPAALRQVLTNLVGNAIRYADPGPIDLRVRREDGRAVVSVTDYGPGIPPERQAQLFEAFRPGAAEERRKAGGLGLGLYISRGIVQAHGGQIWLDSQVGVGSTFTFNLPLNGRG